MPLITAEVPSADTPPAIDGPVLISSAVLSGFETGTGPLNPYGQFQNVKPSAVVDYGVFVYEGHFDVPLAAALSHVRANAPRRTERARRPFRGAAGRSLCAGLGCRERNIGRSPARERPAGDTAQHYRKAHAIAKSVQPEFRATLIADLEARLAGKHGQ